MRKQGIVRCLKVHGLVSGLVTIPGFSGIAVTIQYPPPALWFDRVSLTVRRRFWPLCLRGNTLRNSAAAHCTAQRLSEIVTAPTSAGWGGAGVEAGAVLSSGEKRLQPIA